MRILTSMAILVSMAIASSASAQTIDGYKIVKSPLTVAALEERLKESVAKNKMAIVNRASASDGAKGRGVVIKADVVLGVFRNDFAVRMLASNIDAGIEAPIRLHLVEEADGTSTIRYNTPSAVFAKYPGADLKAVATELDGLMEAVVKDASAK